MALTHIKPFTYLTIHTIHMPGLNMGQNIMNKWTIVCIRMFTSAAWNLQNIFFSFFLSWYQNYLSVLMTWFFVQYTAMIICRWYFQLSCFSIHVCLCACLSSCLQAIALLLYGQFGLVIKNKYFVNSLFKDWKIHFIIHSRAWELSKRVLGSSFKRSKVHI